MYVVTFFGLIEFDRLNLDIDGDDRRTVFVVFEHRGHGVGFPVDLSALEMGDTLRFTDPGWTPLFINATELVMQVGGLMTHGSAVAREYGIPALVGGLGATQRIEIGQRIRVDGNQGYVEIMGDG